MLPFAGLSRVVVVCPHCGVRDARLAATVKKGMRTTCASCRKGFVVDELETVIGTSRPLPPRRR